MSRADGVVSVAFVHGHEVAYSWHQSVLGLVAHDIANGQHVVRGGWLAVKYGTGGIAQARNDAVRRFMAESSDWLLWVDTDMGFAADSVDRLLEHADAESAPVIGGLCFMMREVGIDGLGGMLVQPKPTIFQWFKDGDREGFAAVDSFPKDQLLRVAGTGSAFILIHRSAFAKVAELYGQEWYTQIRNPSGDALLSEDLSFCARLAAADVPVYVHTGVVTSHLKHVWLDDRLFDRLQPANPENTGA